MDVLVAILLAGGIISIGSHLIRRRREDRQREANGAADAGERSLEQLRPGDVVVHERVDLIVDTVVQLQEGPTVWIECELRDGEQQYALVLHPSDPEHAMVGQPVEDLPLHGAEPPESLDHEGRILHLRCCGQARVVHSAGVSEGIRDTGVWDHWDYARSGNDRLWLRRHAGRFRCFAGERVARHLLELICS